MKSMMSKMFFSPKELKNSIENEPMMHKARIIVASVAMSVIATSYGQFFNSVVFRSGQMQAEALAGKRGFVDFVPWVTQPFENTSSSEHPFDIETDKYQRTWDLKNQLSLLKEKDLKDLKHIQKDWVDRYYYQWSGEDSTAA